MDIRLMTYQVHLIIVHLRLPTQRREMRPRSPLNPLSFLPILELIVDSPVQHHIVTTLGERIDLRRFMRACGDFLPHAVTHLDDFYNPLSARSTNVCKACWITITATRLLRSHDQLRVFGELIRILLVSLGRTGVGDLVEVLEELGDFRFDQAVAGDGGFVLAHVDLYVPRTWRVDGEPLRSSSSQEVTLARQGPDAWFGVGSLHLGMLATNNISVVD